MKTEINHLQIMREINYDIETGVYNFFPLLKEQLREVAHRLSLSHYVQNREISKKDIRILEENGYL